MENGTENPSRLSEEVARRMAEGGGVNEESVESREQNIGDLIDELARIRSDADALSASFKAVEDEYKAQDQEVCRALITAFREAGLEAGAGSLRRAGMKQEAYYSIEDPEPFYEYVKENDAWDLLTKRVSSKAVKARLKREEDVPGLRIFEKTVVNLSKVSSK